MARRIRRCDFVLKTAGFGSGLFFLSKGYLAFGVRANDRLNIALVGIGGRGRWFVQTIPRLGQNAVAACDVNDRRAGESYKRLPGAKRYHDFREMLDAMGRTIDGVCVATPDFSHAVISLAAIKAGKHVLCEKPLTWSVHESRVLREAARRFKVATQMGNQGTASRGFRRALALIRGGVLGEIKEVFVWNSAGGQGRREPPKGSVPVPDAIKWDLWLGPAHFRLYHPEWMQWRLWREFNTGNLGNWASHSANLAFMALQVDSLWRAQPTGKVPVIRVEAEVSERNRVNFPKWEKIRFHIPARGSLPAITFNWFNGKTGPHVRKPIEDRLGYRLDWGDAGAKKWNDHGGTLIVGTEGKLHSIAHNTTVKLIPEEKFRGVEDPPPVLPPSIGHEREWLRACRGGPAAASNFDYSGPLTEFNMLGNIATQFEGILEYDPVAGRIINNKEANQALRRDYRKGWEV